jgi:competence protein ComEA
VISNAFDNLLTRKEQRIFGFLGALMIIGMVLYHSGISLIYARNSEPGKQALIEATKQDSLVKIDIRTAGMDELILLPGIGEKRAQDIITYRQQKLFESDEELLNIKGIGIKTYLKMKPLLLSFGSYGQGVQNVQELAELKAAETKPVAVSSAGKQQELDVSGDIVKKESVIPNAESMVHLNSATREELMSLSGIGEKKADAILLYRKQVGRFTSVEQLLEVKGIGPKTLEKNRHRLSL